MIESVLLSVKHQLGINEDDTSFDVDLINCINMALNTLTQIGLQPEEGVRITDVEDTWDSILEDDPMLETIKTYIFMKVKLAFDPPQSGGLIDVYKSQIAEMEWRLGITFEFPDI